MPNEEQTGCITKEISGNWLTNGHLEACILKLRPPTDSEWKNDSSRAGNISIVSRLLQPTEEEERNLLEQEFPEKPALVLSPELAFGSPDFDALDALVRQYNQDLIFICGFGFANGDALTALVAKPGIEGIWNSPPNANKKYNGGWVWIKSGDTVQCYMFLKNYFEQGTEITVPNLAEGDSILRIEGNDLVVFPMICADLISKQDNSPSVRIVDSLHTESPSNKRVLITGCLLNHHSASGHWKAAIGDLLEAIKPSNARLMLSNCVNPTPAPAESDDKWRCLSGAYQHREGCKPPGQPLPYMRHVEDTKFAGLVVRNTKTGGVFGKLKWTNNASEGLHAFSECSQQVWSNDHFQACDGDCAADELYRFILRHKGQILHNKITSSQATKTLADAELDALLEELSPLSGSALRSVAGTLFQKCLRGIKKEAPFCPDQLYNEENSLDCAITTLRVLQHAIDAALLPEMPKGEELDYGQLLSADNEHEILIWDSSEHTASQLYNMVKESIVKDGGSARLLTIVGRGNGGGSPPEDGRIKSNRLADIANAPPVSADTDSSADRDICEATDRVVFWKNQGKIDDVLSSTDPNQDLAESLRKEIILSEGS